MLLCPLSPVMADEAKGFYAAFAPQLYLSDKFSSAGIPGARGGAGWELPLLGNTLLIGMEAGIFYTGVNGNNPVPASISLNSLYNYSFNSEWSLNGGVAAGVFFAPRETNGSSLLFFGPRVSGEWDFLRRADGDRFLSTYFGAGLDFNMDNGVFVMPLLEAGVRVRFGRSSVTASSVKETVFEEDLPFEDEDYWEDDDWMEEEEEPYTESVKEPEPAPPPQTPPPQTQPPRTSPSQAQPPQTPPPQTQPPRTPPSQAQPPQTPPPRTEPKVEPPPVVVPNAGQKTESDPGRLPRGSRPVVVMPDGRRGFILEECTIYFGPDLTPVTPAEEAKLRRAVLLLKQYPNDRFIIAGYAAFSGTEQGQNVVSWERVRNVADYLVRQGIKAGRGEVHWFGADRSAVPNNDRAQMAMNRRVEIIILDN